MDLALTDAQRELRERAARYVDDVLIPLEERAELAGGRLPEAAVARVKDAARAARLTGGNHAVEHGGQGWSAFDQVLVQEELGRNTNGVWWHMGGGYNVLSRGSLEQIERYLLPTLRGERADAYAVTEGGAGSDAGGIAATAERTANGWRIRGEKWFVTSGDVSDFDILMVNVVDGDARLPTLFLVDRDRPGIDVGDMRRLLDEAVAWAIGRQQFGQRIYDFQGISFPLADSAADCAAARLLTYQVAQLVDDGADPKLVHGRAAMAKLFASEAAWRCADRCVQVLGGRGYMRTYAAERFLRELRVDR